MKSIAAILALGLVAVVQAQEQCAAVAAKVPSCAVSRFDKFRFQTKKLTVSFRSRVSLLLLLVRAAVVPIMLVNVARHNQQLSPPLRFLVSFPDAVL